MVSPMAVLTLVSEASSPAYWLVAAALWLIPRPEGRVGGGSRGGGGVTARVKPEVARSLARLRQLPRRAIFMNDSWSWGRSGSWTGVRMNKE